MTAGSRNCTRPLIRSVCRCVLSLDKQGQPGHLQRSHRQHYTWTSGVGHRSRARPRLPPRHEPSAEQSVLPRSFRARVRRRSEQPNRSGNPSGHRRRTVAAQAGHRPRGLPYERRPLGVSSRWSCSASNCRRRRPFRKPRRLSRSTACSPHTRRSRPDTTGSTVADGCQPRTVRIDAWECPSTRSMGYGRCMPRRPPSVHDDRPRPQDVPRRQRRERTARPYEPGDVEGPVSGHRRQQGPDRTHHQRCAHHGLDFPDGVAVLVHAPRAEMDRQVP